MTRALLRGRAKKEIVLLRYENVYVSPHDDTMTPEARIAVRHECGPEPEGSLLCSGWSLGYNRFDPGHPTVKYHEDDQNLAHEAYLKLAQLCALDVLKLAPVDAVAELRFLLSRPARDPRSTSTDLLR